MRPLCRVWLYGACLVVFLSTPLWGEAEAAKFLNSTETGCDGSDATVIFCDDFGDGEWLRTDIECGVHTVGTNTKTRNTDCQNAAADADGFTSPNYTLNQGWTGSIYVSGDPACSYNGTVGGCAYPAASSVSSDQWYAHCGTDGVLGSGTPAGFNCYGRSGIAYGATDDMLAPVAHSLGPTTNTRYNEAAVRWYERFSNGFTWTDTKILSVMHEFNNNGIIEMGHVGCNKGGDSHVSSCEPVWCPSNNVQCYSQNQSNGSGTGTPLSFSANGHWFNFQAYFIMNSTSGSSDCTVKLYIDDCGANGACSTSNGQPTLRMSYTNVNCWSVSECPNCTAGSHGIGSWDFEFAYQNAPSWQSGMEYYVALFKSVKNGGTIPIAFAGSGAATAQIFPTLRASASWPTRAAIVGVNAAHMLLLSGYVWQRRTALVRSAMQIWREAVYHANALAWTYRYKVCIKRWQAAAPRMLPAPVQTVECQPQPMDVRHG